MAAFKWNGGGSWQGKAWTTELPTDSQAHRYQSDRECVVAGMVLY